jgi:hypothetical protein
MTAMNIILVQGIASDAASIIESRLPDHRRSTPFEHLSERTDSNLAADLRLALVRQSASLAARHPAVAEQLDELLGRLDQLPR